MTDRISHRAAVEAGYASLAEYITEWKDRPDEGYADQRTLEIVAHLHCENERLREALKEISCDCDHCCNENGLGCDNWTARSALQQKEEDK